MKENGIMRTIVTERLLIVPLSRRAFERKRRELPAENELRRAMDELRGRARKDFPWRFAWYTDREIYLRGCGGCIGSIASMNSPYKNPWERGYIEIGYSMEKPFRGKGYMTEAVEAVCRMILGERRVRGIIAGVAFDNIASQRVLEKCGFARAQGVPAEPVGVWLKKQPENENAELRPHSG